MNNAMKSYFQSKFFVCLNIFKVLLPKNKLLKIVKNNIFVRKFEAMSNYEQKGAGTRPI